jgi:hypothetical protein
MWAINRGNGKSLAVSHFSAENQLYEAQRKTSNHRRSRQEIRCPHRTSNGQVLARRTRETVSRCREDHRFREAENARQAFKISSNLFGSSPYPSARIDRTKSSSRDVANIPRSTSISSFLCFLALASCGRRPRLFFSAITSRMSSSFMPFAMSEAQNDTVPAIDNQLHSFANPVMRAIAVSSHSVENQKYEAQAKASDHGQGCSEGCSTNGRDMVATLNRGKNRTAGQGQLVHFLRERERALAKSAIRLTCLNTGLYTVCSRWARNFAWRASSHSACTASQSGLPAGISEIRNRLGSL